MSLTKQAKVLTKQQQDAVLAFLQTTKEAKRNKVIFLLSVRAGLRAKEIAFLTWDMVSDASNTISDAIYLQDSVSKGKSGGIVWLNRELKEALNDYRKSLKTSEPYERIIKARDRDVRAQMVVNLFWNWYKRLGFTRCSSHSGRRTFITSAAKKISTVGGSIKDVQMLARHKSLQMTQRYIEADVEAQKKVVQLV
jgi:integrase